MRAGKLLDGDRVANRDFVLLSAGLDDCKLLCFHRVTILHNYQKKATCPTQQSATLSLSKPGQDSILEIRLCDKRSLDPWSFACNTQNVLVYFLQLLTRGVVVINDGRERVTQFAMELFISLEVLAEFVDALDDILGLFLDLHRLQALEDRLEVCQK